MEIIGQIFLKRPVFGLQSVGEGLFTIFTTLGIVNESDKPKIKYYETAYPPVIMPDCAPSGCTA